jgi:hypothetical protein
MPKICAIFRNSNNLRNFKMIRSLLILLAISAFSTQAFGWGSVAMNKKMSGGDHYRFYFSDNSSKQTADITSVMLCSRTEGQGNCTIFGRWRKGQCISIYRKVNQNRVTKILVEGAAFTDPRRKVLAIRKAEMASRALCQNDPNPGLCSKVTTRCFVK